MRSHGSTVSVTLEMREFGYAPSSNNQDKFTEEVYNPSGRQTPVNDKIRDEAKGSKGWFFLSIEGQPGSLSKGVDLKAWELVVQGLHARQDYKGEQFFGAVLGLFPGDTTAITTTETFQPWPQFIDYNAVYSLLVYVYHPALDRWSPRLGQLLLSSSVPLSSVDAFDQLIDSPYDLRRWSFSVASHDPLPPKRAWIRIGEEISQPLPPGSNTLPQQGPPTPQLRGTPDWGIDLPLVFNPRRSKIAGQIFVIGVLIAVPYIVTIFIAGEPTAPQKWLAAGLALLFGFAAAIAAVFGIPKLG